SYTIQLNSLQQFNIRLLGGSIWDIPSSQLSPDLIFYPDPLWSSMQLYSYSYPFYPMVTTQGSWLKTIQGQEGDWPFLNRSSPGNIVISSQVSLGSSRF